MVKSKNNIFLITLKSKRDIDPKYQKAVLPPHGKPWREPFMNRSETESQLELRKVLKPSNASLIFSSIIILFDFSWLKCTLLGFTADLKLIIN